MMLKDRDHRLFKMEEDIGQIQEKHQHAQEQFWDVQSELKIVQMNVSSSEKQIQHHSVQAQFYEEAFTNAQLDLEKWKEQCQQCTKSLESAEQKIHDLNREKNVLEENQKQTVEKIHKYEENILEMTNALTQANQQSNENIRNIAGKEELLETLKTECSTLQEKLRLQVNEVEQLRNELNIFENKYNDAQNKLETLHRALEAARTDSSRLHQESELVVANVNQWIKEQKLANESLGEKVREQNKLMVHLAAEKDHIQEIKDALTKEIKKVKTEYEEMQIENERLKVLRSHSANQEALLSQLRGQLQVQEYEQENLLTEKLAAMEDMHTRLKANIESIHLLNQQLNSLSNENVHLKQKWENEKHKCQQLQLQLETCNQTVCSIQAKLKDKKEKQDTSQLTPPHGATGCLLDVMKTRDSEQTGIEESIDKSYWIQRVGELSAQLQESTEYWTEKMNELTHGIQHCRVESPQK